VRLSTQTIEKPQVDIHATADLELMFVRGPACTMDPAIAPTMDSAIALTMGSNELMFVRGPACTMDSAIALTMGSNIALTMGSNELMFVRGPACTMVPAIAPTMDSAIALTMGSNIAPTINFAVAPLLNLELMFVRSHACRHTPTHHTSHDFTSTMHSATPPPLQARGIDHIMKMEVVVFGSISMDLIATVPTHPKKNTTMAAMQLETKNGTVRVFDRNLLSRSAIEFHAFAPLDARPCVRYNGIPLGCLQCLDAIYSANR
jgi:hypothetical protein